MALPWHDYAGRGDSTFFLHALISSAKSLPMRSMAAGSVGADLPLQFTILLGLDLGASCVLNLFHTGKGLGGAFLFYLFIHQGNDPA